MARRKQFKIAAKETYFYEFLVNELSKYPELESDYDMESIEITILKKKAPPRIKDIDKAIDNLKRYIHINGKDIPTYNGEQLITKKKLPQMLKVSRPTLDKWIKAGFIEKGYSKTLRKEFYQTDAVLEQLTNQKKKI